MLLKVVREKEVTYYNSYQIKAVIVSRVYEDDGSYDVSFDMYNGLEPIRVFKDKEKAEEFVQRLATMMSDEKAYVLVDCDKL
ncbi:MULTISPECIES: hypothetical protein [Terrabacteria group]|uniref:hypothetical protein n=1 Tax=Bacillati TaxID=1783272 RepID=UPI001939551E|nr:MULTISPECIES: hypothetical protein [Terrabacteria group]MBW9212215.1 hypothetical protein [Trueperella sp. zg.1013]QRG86240.1 hypothetical protein JOS54_05085 [Bulleidia sp. zg-1006]